MSKIIKLKWMEQTGKTLARHQTHIIELKADDQIDLFCLVYKTFKSATFSTNGHYEFVEQKDKEEYKSWEKGLNQTQSMNLHYLGRP